jgi:hypothetical protein
MSQFPLYTSLVSGLNNKDLNVLQKNELVNKISSLPQDTQELIYALIKCYYIEHNKDKIGLPYKAQIIKDKLEFNLLDFPNELRQMLYKFVNLHSKKVIEDEKIKEIQKS